MRPFRFLAGAGDVVDARRLADRARKAEDIGYSVLVFSDHLLDQLAPIPAMAVVATATERLRMGTFVLNNDLRHPAVLAQDLASLDVLSEGRLEIGLGAGWNQPEYRAIGVPFERHALRVERMEEAIAVMKGLFADEPFTFNGKHYTITEMDGLPKPAQKPHPPLLIGGGGRRVLGIAGREANIVGLAPRIGADGRAVVASCLMPALAEKIQWVREAAGERFHDLEINTYPSLSPVLITDNPRKPAEELVGRIRDRYAAELSVEDVLNSPHVFIGSIDGLIEKFQELRRRFGISSIMAGGIDDLAPVVERLAGT